MAEARFILQVLNEIQAYYRQTYNPTQVDVLLRQLKAVPAWALRKAVDEWLDTEDRWLPRGSQLLAIARRLMERLNPGAVLIPVQLQELKDSYCRDGTYDWTRWEVLISLADELGLTNSADAIRRAHGAITDPPDENAGLAYADWNVGPAGEETPDGDKLKEVDPDKTARYEAAETLDPMSWTTS